MLEFIGSLRKQDRSFLLGRFEAIRDFPGRHADYRTTDASGRELDGHIAGRFAIVFWDDFSDHHLKILGVMWADSVL